MAHKKKKSSPSSKKKSSRSSGRTVTLKDGKTLSGDAAKAYGDSKSSGTFKASDGSSVTINKGRVTSGGGAKEDAKPQIRTEATAEEKAQLEAILNNPSLSDDMKAAIRSVYGATVEGDAAKAARVVAAMQAASEFSDPYFKAQIRLATDALKRGIEAKDGDLAFAEREKQAALAELRANTAASKDVLSFQHNQELQQLATKYETDLGEVRDSLAATGFTSSTKRARTESILNEQNTGLVESSTKEFGYKTGNLDRALTSADADTRAQIENLRRLTEEGKLDLYRSAEQTVGSSNLPSIDGLSGVGGIGGTIPRQQVIDATSFANSFVF